GNYSVTVSDSNGCTQQNTFTLLQQQAVSFVTTSLPDTCSRGVGFATVTLNSGTPPYNYFWSPISSSSSSIFNAVSGNYSVDVQDANGCSDTQNFFIDDFGTVHADLGSDKTICPGNELELFA